MMRFLAASVAVPISKSIMKVMAKTGNSGIGVGVGETGVGVGEAILDCVTVNSWDAEAPVVVSFTISMYVPGLSLGITAVESRMPAALMYRMLK